MEINLFVFRGMISCVFLLVYIYIYIYRFIERMRDDYFDIDHNSVYLGFDIHMI